MDHKKYKLEELEYELRQARLWSAAWKGIAKYYYAKSRKAFRGWEKALNHCDNICDVWDAEIKRWMNI